ncbi:GTP 3',8-cyclase MoaA [Alkalibacter saccharofermentans]|uniref:GTP 3',8-cyclase n=1 Tax=Alkalibacter saccharofermentans DSM 14828 TaxID=1120975 RepID=A0A1M4TNM2_9FIRM|nr:GTP 3',8-cyclase MoaA [Alkalibacter saccharofermentans]SHE46109.1 cyclic pyranopterin monophosphate synthase subunit MoaA [Alkalibacter saccharofermentans DSM 14828]
MKDRYGRKIEYLRISVTQNCNLKCIYCDPEGDNCKEDMDNNLSPVEIESIVRSMAKIGIKKVRITGGEPLVRSDIVEIVKRVSSVKGIEDVSMTTNGISLHRYARQLKDGGLKRLNVSIDSLKEEKFRMITGGGDLKKTLEGIDMALDVGLMPIKINTVLIRGVNDDEIDDFINLSKDRPIESRFIELMPIGDFGEKNADKIVFNADVINERPYLKYLKRSDKGAPAQYYTVEGYQGKVGFISPMSHKFCSDCNRIRLTSDGRIRPCLGDNGEVDIMEMLRKNPGDLDKLIHEIVYNKPIGHHFGEDYSSSRKMSRIGG